MNNFTLNHIEDMPLDEELTIDIRFRDILYYNPSERSDTSEARPQISGEAHFTAETTLIELNQHTEIYDIQHTVNGAPYEFQIELFYNHPVIHFIELSTEDPAVLEQDFQLMDIRGTDEMGNEVVFDLSKYTESEEYRKYSFSLNEEQSELTTTELADAQQLDLQFYLADWPEGGSGEAELQPYGEPFIIKMK